ncbi:ABC transporter substrate-binding protein [Marispirochaeta sp.]|jgi:polar amino acid transport system substrate-binding protein|uniref:ABC transporter substrate-binding protein n=1 Tax=Marispirochaeta sp. TaxID=2038653 RepID=UPI0029C7E8F5|nr:ABC transporter substrate-binding protein [Marispirochaeta sp.]
MKRFTYGIIFLLILSLAMPLFAGGNKEGDNIIQFAGSGGYPPFNFINEDNEVIGFDVDVAREIAERLGYELDYVTTAWDGIIEGLRAGRYNGILGSMAITPERQEVVDFSEPYYYSGAQLIVSKKSGINSPADLTGKHNVGLVTGTTFAQDAEKLGVNIKFYEDDNQTLMELINGRLHAVITDRVVGLNAMSKIQGGDNLTLAGELLRKEECAIAFQKDDPLRDKVNNILKEMREDGTLAKISENWFNGENITNP